MQTLLFIPGLMCDERLFARQAAALAGKARVACARVDGPPDMRGLAAMLLDRHPGTLCVAGLSMGGIVAMEMVRQAPERVERLALMDTNHHADLPERFLIRNRQIEDVRNGGLMQVIVEEMRPTYLAAANAGNEALLELVLDMALALGPDLFERQSLALRDRNDQTEALRAYGGPTLVLCGVEDRLCPPDRHQEMTRLLANSELVMVEQAGHLSSVEQPDAVSSALAHWLLR